MLIKKGSHQHAEGKETSQGLTEEEAGLRSNVKDSQAAPARCFDVLLELS